MDGQNTNVPDWKQRLTAELKRDRKKTAALAVLLAVAGIVAGRLICNTPESAEAGTYDRSGAEIE